MGGVGAAADDSGGDCIVSGCTPDTPLDLSHLAILLRARLCYVIVGDWMRWRSCGWRR